jgi:3-oxoacyl-[acyl-carrier protein] reductase
MNEKAQDKVKLSGRTAVVTGGSRGIGAAIAKALANEGAAVALIHHDDCANAHRALTALKALNRRCVALNCDVTDPQQVRLSIDTVYRQLGGLDILVNCAGIGGGGPFEEMTLELWNRIISVNLTGAFLMTRYCYPLMKKKRWGRIINISSQMAFSGGVGVAAYCASKAGLIGFTRGLAIEAAKFGVLVNNIAPGATLTDMLRSIGEDRMRATRSKIPLGRFGKPEEIAPTAVLLASDDGAFYVGQTLSPNGGDVFR